MAGEWLRVRNWERWQSYRKDRGQPPWIKLHRRLQQNVDWISLSDTQRGQLMSMWLLAAGNNGFIPASPATIKKLCFMDSKLDLQVFFDKGFLERDAYVTPTWQPPGCHDDAPEAETEENREETEAEAETESDLTPKSPRTHADLEIPEGLTTPEVHKAIDDWLAHKRRRKETYKDSTHMNGLLRDFARDGPEVFVHSVKICIQQDYKGLFNKGKPHGNRGRPGPQVGPGQSYDPSTRDTKNTF